MKTFLLLSALLILSFSTLAQHKFFYKISILEKSGRPQYGTLSAATDSNLTYHNRKLGNIAVPYNEIKFLRIEKEAIRPGIQGVTGLAALGNTVLALVSSKSITEGALRILLGNFAIGTVGYLLQGGFRPAELIVNFETDKPDPVQLKERLQPFIVLKQ